MVRRLASEEGVEFRRAPRRMRAEVAAADLPGGRAVLAIPATFMNESGRAVAPLLHYYKVPVERLVLVHDDIDLPFGKLRFHFGRGTGGHNGVASVVGALGSVALWRLKVGVGRPPGRMDPADFVLRPLPVKAAPDGYTFFVGAVHHTIAPSFYPKLDYNILTDLVPLTVIANPPQILVVNPKRVAADDFKSFMTLLRANPGKLNYASAGNGTSHHLAGELFKQQSKTFIDYAAKRFVQYLGDPPMHYLANWRIQLGSRLLRESNRTVATVALDVGYDSEAAFSRAFKRMVGMPPAAWKRAQASR